MQFEILKENENIIKVIGVGGGGSNAVTHMHRQGIVGVDFIIYNTDHQAMEQSDVPTKIQLAPINGWQRCRFKTHGGQTSMHWIPGRNTSHAEWKY